MTVNRKRKVTKLRGNTTHGYGSMKKNRGAGNRGGRGRAGSGKRGDSKKPRYQVANQKGKFGFKPRTRSVITIKPINIGLVEKLLPKLVKLGQVEEKSGVYIVDLEKIGFNKLLGTGKISAKMQITVSFASAKAIEKVKQTGGEVKINSVKEDVASKEV